MSLTPLSRHEAERLRRLFLDAGYTEKNLRAGIKLREPGSGHLRNLPRLHDVTSVPSCTSALLRWFWGGVTQDAVSVTPHLPNWFIPLATECGLLRREREGLVPEVLLLPVEGFLVAADHLSKIEAVDSELVLWTNPTTRLLSDFTVRRPSSATLDLGTGNGIQALLTAAHSKTVVATDLNPRAINLAVFNMALNGVENVECLLGDSFEPVAGRKFDLIVCNPPYYLAPSHQYFFCHSKMELDGLCRSLAKQAPAYLNQGGYLQMLCEWVEIRGQSWEQRVAEWCADTGCDSWVIKRCSQEPSEYAEQRIRQTVSSSEHDADLYAEYMDYFRGKNVVAIHGGMITLRRREGRIWHLVETIPQAPKHPFGDSVQRIFAGRDFLDAHPKDADLLAAKVKLSDDARLHQTMRQHERGWKRESFDLRLASGFEFFAELQPVLADFLVRCDGTHTIGEVITEFASRVNAPKAELQEHCLKVVRRLVERGFLLCAAE